MKNGKNRNATVRSDEFNLGFGYCQKDGSPLFCYDSRKRPEFTWRRWQCPECGERITTHEITVGEHKRLLATDIVGQLRDRVLKALEVN